MPYLNVDEVESALVVATSGAFAPFTILIPLPNATWNGRTCNAVKIANGDASGRPGVYFLGGIHSREWGSPDILVNFVEQLQQAYLAGTGITLGGQVFSALEIGTIVDNLDVFVFPQANPDGRDYSMNTDSSWRKNRRTAAPNSSSGSCVGVDLNRNYDFLWDFETLFAPTSTVSASADPCDFETYHGPSAFSEPESSNVRWLHDNHPNIGFFIDLHSFGPDILYSWGDDDNQSTDPGMNFQNPAYDSVRGIIDGYSGASSYREYIPTADAADAVALANAFAAGIQAVRGTSYLVEQSVGLYPTAGASDDYSYSRHFVDGSKHNVLAYTLEWGDQFQPPYAEMQNIIQEITSGLIAFCAWVRKSIEACAITVDRSTFGKDEIDAMLHVASPARVEAAFYVTIDGWRHEELGITAATLTGVPDVKPAIAFNPPLGHVFAEATACSAEGNTLVAGPQRFTWTFRLRFDDSSDFTQEVLPVTMTASLPANNGDTATAQAVITLTTQPNPYEIDGAVSWLSVDLQVCQVLENGSLPSTPGVVLNSGPNTFITQLVTAYNDPMLPRAPNHPFDLDLVANEDTSSVEIAGTVGSPAVPVFNFAIARVRYKALATPAPNVRVFFRIFQASTTSTAFEPASTYLTGGAGGTKIPLLGVANGEVVSIPCFAAARIDPTNPGGLNAQTDPINVGPLGNPIPPDGSGAEVQAYFGCWLDINQSNAVLPLPATAAGPFVPAQSIQQAIMNKHQCLVAEINLDPPEPQIATGTTPAMSDKLAQRNLNVVGVASPHVVPTTFELKPTPSLRPGEMPDELLIDWGRLPDATTADIYLPGLSAAEIVSAADHLYQHHELSIVDEHTLRCKAAGMAYVPLPAGGSANRTGLLTLNVGGGTRRGERFRVVVRQVTSALALENALARAGSVARAEDAARDPIRFRRVVGSFQISIPVSTQEALRGPEERLLSVLRWIRKSVPNGSRWRPAFERYVEQIAGRVNALGGDAAAIGPSSSGDWRAAGRCRNAGRLVSALLGLFFAAAGSLTGSALTIAPVVLAILLLLGGLRWFRRCSPSRTAILGAAAEGTAVAAVILAIVLLAGFAVPQTQTFLSIIVVLLALLYLIMRSSEPMDAAT